MRRVFVTVSVLAFVTLAGISAQRPATKPPTDQWPQFRGPQAGTIPDDPALPDTWSETQNVVWKTDIPGFGWSSPSSGTITSS